MSASPSLGVSGGLAEEQGGGMSDQYDRVSAYLEGFDDAHDGCAKANPYFSYYQGEFDLWKAYEKGYREGSTPNAEPTT